MTPRDTGTGWVLEQMVLPALSRGEYSCRTQVRIGSRPGGGRHVVDAVATKDGRSWLISVKWQQVSGTAEQKVPFEVICLTEIVQGGEYDGAYLVLGGEGWKLREYYVSGGLARHLPNATGVKIVTLEAFVGLANRGKL